MRFLPGQHRQRLVAEDVLIDVKTNEVRGFNRLVFVWKACYGADNHLAGFFFWYPQLPVLLLGNAMVFSPLVIATSNFVMSSCCKTMLAFW